ncbi:MAG: hypothetical protein U0821_18520 [Chloroflexota bacterium]
MSRLLLSVALAITVLATPHSPPIVFAQDGTDLVSGLPQGQEGGFVFGQGEGGYRVTAEMFDGTDPRIHRRIIPLPKSVNKNAGTLSMSIKLHMLTGVSGDQALLFGASERGYYYFAIVQDYDQVIWALGHWQRDGNVYTKIATGVGDWVNEARSSELNFIQIDIYRQPGSNPLIKVWINEYETIQTEALHGESGPLSPFGDVGILCATYPELGEAAFLFNGLFVSNPAGSESPGKPEGAPALGPRP